jgi:hypothetical protein
MVTLMFIVYFVPFTITNAISRWGLPFGLCFTQKTFETYLIIRSLCEFLKDLNFCTNFIIYCISGRRFRYALCSLIHRNRRKLSASLRYHDSTKQRTERILLQNIQKIDPLNPKQAYEESLI